MTAKRTRLLLAAALLLSAGCAPKRQAAAPPPPPPAPRQNLFVLLPETGGKVGAIAVTNQAGRQELNQGYQAVRVERADAPPSAPFAMPEADVKRLFGPALDVLPEAELHFTLYFEEARDVLTAESQAQLPAIMAAVKVRRSTDVSVTGHTDTTGKPESNYQLGLRRARRVAELLRAAGVAESDLSVESHGEADLLVKTARGVAEARNRRVEVTVR
jgi:outer membrane protein OmpA-like peptidoglycan-associated protein